MVMSNKQRGSTLIIALIMLVLMTLIAVSAINMSTSGIHVVGNAQFRQEAAAAAQQAIETVLSSTAFMLAPPLPQNIDINNDGDSDYTVIFNPPPACQAVKPVIKGDIGVPPKCAAIGATTGTLCYWTMWEITAVVNDPKTGARTVTHQGVRTIASIVSAATSCGI